MKEIGLFASLVVLVCPIIIARRANKNKIRSRMSKKNGILLNNKWNVEHEIKWTRFKEQFLVVFQKVHF